MYGCLSCPISRVGTVMDVRNSHIHFVPNGSMRLNEWLETSHSVWIEVGIILCCVLILSMLQTSNIAFRLASGGDRAWRLHSALSSAVVENAQKCPWTSRKKNFILSPERSLLPLPSPWWWRRKLLWNMGQNLPDYTVHYRRQPSLYSSPREPQILPEIHIGTEVIISFPNFCVDDRNSCWFYLQWLL